jgi:hypothetical protein
VIAAARIVWLLTGGVWATQALVGFAEPDYWDPVTTLDFAAVWLYSAGFLTLALTVTLLGRLVPTRSVRRAAIVMAIAALVTGVANGIEDGLGVKTAGTVYVIGALALLISTLVLVVALGRAGLARLAWMTGGLAFGLLLVSTGGGLIILGMLGALAVRPAWFLVADPEPPIPAVPARRSVE